MNTQKTTTLVNAPGSSIVANRPEPITRRCVLFRVDGRDGKTYRIRMGEDHPQARISNATTEAVRLAYEAGEGSYLALSKRFGIGKSTVRDIVTYRKRTRG